MNLLEFSIKSQKEVSFLKGKEFANRFIELRSYSFKNFHNGIILSSSHGIDYFNNIIKYWNNPDDYCEKPDKVESDNYEYNFILLLKQNQAA